MKQIAQALVKAQKEFAPALKTSTNPHFKSKYVGLDGCVEAVIDALNNNGIALIQRNHECADGVKVETIFLHESGEEFSGGILHVPAIKNDPQAYGSALTYARRYSLMASCGIAPEDDDGNAARAILQSAHMTTKEYEWAVQKLIDCQDLEQLKQAFAMAYPLCNATHKANLKIVYDQNKAKLSGETL